MKDGDWVRLQSRAGETALRALVTDRVAPGVVYTTFHHPLTQANVITTDFSDWATNCPEYKVTAVQVSPSNGPTRYQRSTRSSPVSRGASPPKRRSDGMDAAGDRSAQAGRAAAAGDVPRVRRIAGLRFGADGSKRWLERAVPAEVPVALVHDGATTAVMMATPADLQDFAVGFSLSERIVTAVDDIREIETVAQEGGVEVRIWLKPGVGAGLVSRRRAIAGRPVAASAASTASRPR